MAGTLYGLGVGPGGSGLVTQKAKDILGRTQVLCLPKSGPGRESVALQVAAPFLPAGVAVEELLFPMSRDREVLVRHWKLAAERVAGLLDCFGAVTFITIGDPLVYSTFGYLMRHLLAVRPAARIEVVPGVTSFVAAASRLQLPLVEGDERLAVLTVPVTAEELAACAAFFHTLVLLKVSADYGGTLQLLKQAGLEKEAYLVSRLGGEGELVCHAPFSLSGDTVDYLSLLIVKNRGLQA